MVESDDDFAELCSKLLKRVKKNNNPSESQNVPKTSTAARGRVKKAKPPGSKKQKNDGGSREAEEDVKAGPDGGNTDHMEERNEIIQSLQTKEGIRTNLPEGDPRPPDQMSVKELVLDRMQQFKREAPKRMKLDSTEISEAPVGSSEAHPSVQNDGALALALQMDVKKKSASLEDEGLFFCQLCQKDLTTMSSVLREQHVNRCLDQGEGIGGSSVTPVVPSCPLCGKPFSTEKSRAAHLKRCAAKLEVPAQTLLQAVQRQEAEAGSEVPARVVNGKRKAVPKQKEPSKKRKTAKTGAEMEDLMVAMALSRSMQEDKKAQTTDGGEPVLAMPAREKKSRRKQKDKPTPLLLAQRPEEAVEKLQRRLSLLLSEETAENKVMTLPASHFWTTEEEEERYSWRLPGGERCVLWDISNMMETRDTLSYYTAELNPPITPWKSPIKKLHSSQTHASTTISPPEKPQSQTAGDQDPEPTPEDKPPLSYSQRALLDLAELAGEGMTLTQWNAGASTLHEHTGRESPVSITLSGFIPEQEEKSRNERRPHHSKMPLLVLSADFMEMVNNPHLSDAQLQTDCGEVLNAHTFVLYARCPLLVEAIHTEGFWVDESGIGRARRLLLNDVSAEAALCFLRFLYSATTDIPSHCLPHVCELARRFGVNSLIDACEHLISVTHNSEGEIIPEEEEDDGGERAETFQELLKSMWLEEGEEDLPVDVEDEEKPDDGAVGEVELEEIYEFALTQRKILAEPESMKDESEQEVEDPEKSEDHSPKSRNLHLEEAEVDLMITPPPKVSQKPEEMEHSPRKSPVCLLSNSPEYCVAPCITPLSVRPSSSSSAASLQSPSQFKVAETSPLKKDITSHNSASSKSPVPVISLISPNRDEDPDADMFSPHSPPPLDDSYDHMFSQTCGEYGEPSGICESKSQINPTSPEEEPPILTSSPTVMASPALPELGSSPNIKPHSELYQPSYLPEHGKSPQSTFKNSLCKDTSQGASSREEDIILILSSDEEMESSDQSGKSASKAIKESPVSFSQRRSSGDCPRLEMSSSSEMSWLVPATPLPQSVTSKISMLQTSSLPQSPQTLQNESHTKWSSPKSLRTSHATSSSPKLPRTSHLVWSPPKSPRTSHANMSSPKSPRTSHATSSSPKLPRTSHIVWSPPKSPRIPHAAWSPAKSPESPLVAQSPRKSPGTPLVAQSPLKSRRTPLAVQSPPNSQIKSPSGSQQTPRSSQASRHLDFNISCQSFVSQTQVSSVSLPLISPRTPQSSKPSIHEKLEAQSSVCSKVLSSPPVSIASSTVFEVGDSEDEAPVAEAQANISNTSFQFDYDEPPIPMEDDMWCMNETPRRPDSPPAPSPPLHLNDTPTKPLQGKPNVPLHLDETPTRPLGDKPDTPSPAQSTTPASIEASPQDSSQSRRQSYLNSKLWEDWEEDDPELPAVLPLSQRLNKLPEVQKELRTPVSIVRKRELAPKVPITPLPDYSDMDTPILKKELSRFGVRALPKKQMVLKLKEIFSYTHQVMSSDSEDDVPSSQAHRTKGSSVASAPQKPLRDKQRPENTAKGARGPNMGRKGTSVCTAPEIDTGDDQPLTASQESTTSSVAPSDTSSLSQSSNTNEFETAFADEDDDEPVAASQAASKEAQTAETVRRYIEARPDLHKQILLYQPLDLAALHADLKLNGIRIAAGKLLDFLDSHCITFTTAAARKEKKSRTRRKGGKRY